MDHDAIIAQVEDQGYALIPAALSPDLCAAAATTILAEYARLSAAGWRPDGGGRLAGHLNIRLGAVGADLMAALEQAGIADLAQRLAPGAVALSQAAGNLNLPGSIAQDFHIDGEFDVVSVIANVCLVPTDAENGATALVPASHHRAMPYWRFWREGHAAHALAPPTRPGDVVLRTSTLWHRGMPNRSATARPMAAFVWSPGTEMPLRRADLTGPPTFHANKYYGPLAAAKETLAVRLPLADRAVRLASSWLRDRKG